MELIADWKKQLEQALDGEPIAAEDLRFGVFYTAEAHSTRHVGVAFTPRALADTVCCPKTAAATPDAGRLAGRSAWELASFATAEAPLKRAIGVASLNALSALATDRVGFSGARVCPGLDALDAAKVCAADRVVMVGAFLPFIRSLKGKVASLSIIDRHRAALGTADVGLWTPPERAGEALSDASVVIISASSLVEGAGAVTAGGLEALLAACPRARRVVLAGPTAPLWTRPFFSRGVDIIGGIRVLDGARILAVVSEGGSGYSFKDASEKVSLMREDVGA